MSDEKKKKIKLKKRKTTLSSLFNDNRFLMIFSLVMAFIIWVGVSADSGETGNYPITDIPVVMDLSEDAENDNLNVVSIDGVPVDEFTATVRVKGNNVTVGSLTKSDIQVYGANLGNIVTSGTYTVTLLAKQVGIKNNYDIVSLNPSEVTVVVDRNIIKEFTLESMIEASAPSDYYKGNPDFSVKTVSVSGPEQSVQKVAKAVVSYKAEKELTSTTVLKGLHVDLLDENGDVIEDDALTTDPVEVDVTIPVLVKKKVPVTLICENKPEGLNMDEFVSIEPSEIEIAGSSDVIDTVSSINIGPLNFNELSYGKALLDYEVTMPEGIRNLNNIEKAMVKFDYTKFSVRSFTVTSFKFENVPEGLVAEYSPYSNVIVRMIGPKNEISDMTSSDILSVIDLTGETIGNTDVNLNISVLNHPSCWVYGSYQLNVTVSDASTVSSQSNTDTSSNRNNSSRTDDTDRIE